MVRLKMEGWNGDADPWTILLRTYFMSAGPLTPALSPGGGEGEEDGGGAGEDGRIFGSGNYGDCRGAGGATRSRCFNPYRGPARTLLPEWQCDALPSRVFKNFGIQHNQGIRS